MTNKKKKILHIAEAMGGGVFTYIVDLTQQHCDEYEVYLAYGLRSQTPVDFQRYFDKRVKLIEVKSFDRSINPIKDGKAFFEIKEIAKSITPDIIHLHSSKAGALGRVAFNGKDSSLFYTPHGYSFLMENGSSLKRGIYKTIEMVLGKRVCTTIACSPGEYKESLKLTKSAIYINNGIDTNSVQNMSGTGTVTKKTKQLIIYTSGRISYQKNPEQFNKIAAQNPTVKFLWIGDGELREKLISPNIEITGWVSREKALELSANANIFILTSLWEGLPISLLEAMLMKKLCLVSNVIGNNDVIESDTNGFVCNSSEEFTSIIDKVNSNSLNVERLISTAHQDVLYNYNTAVMGKKYKEAYNLQSREINA